ncbi:homeodomain-interacting protein kinase 2-like isoform X2 [Synchiropus splendidus]|uniref:homeodomain-interacting protein kinase 2-like isoform X2 n=1 Tax=Synchiropus splendidus TaxID=270530 RepID=UPI00237D5F38|nr:homeodomain-interacting protein kinase 2-like isoform X2 [Synchiropus splendidus]
MADKTESQPCVPTEYKLLRVLGEGSFSKVVKCRKRVNGDIVALKLLWNPGGFNELQICERMKKFDVHKKNIVKFIDSFRRDSTWVLVFEALDISLDAYIMKTHNLPMSHTDIRTIVQQMAVALDQLAKMGIIHTDVKTDNIVLVNQQRPFRVKLIDFGLSIVSAKAKAGTSMQALAYRAPEIILGLPFGEPIDMWSLGIVMTVLINGTLIMEPRTELSAIHQILELLRQPHEHLLQKGIKSKKYFIKSTKGWRLKSHKVDMSCFQSLDELKEKSTQFKEEESRENCFDLLKAMLQVDPDKRITPKKVLAHPFISSRPFCSGEREAIISDSGSS